MNWLGKAPTPVDRALREVERELAAVQKQIRMQTLAQQLATAQQRAASPAPPAPRRASPDTDVLDVAGGTLPETCDGMLALPQPAEPDLFSRRMSTAAAQRPAANDGRFGRYLGAGLQRGRRPLRHQERENRNRFFWWVGLSGVALWLLYVLVR